MPPLLDESEFENKLENKEACAACMKTQLKANERLREFNRPVGMCGSDRRTSSTSLNFIILLGRDMMTCRESTHDLCLNYMDV